MTTENVSLWKYYKESEYSAIVDKFDISSKYKIIKNTYCFLT